MPAFSHISLNEPTMRPVHPMSTRPVSDSANWCAAP